MSTAPAHAAAPCQRIITNSSPTVIAPAIFMTIPVPMTLPSFSTSTIDVPGGTVADVDVTVHLTHPSDDQIGLTVSNGSVPKSLKGFGGTSGANFSGTTFDDEATQGITAGTPPYSGSYQPVEALSAYDGPASTSTWTLTVSNMSLLPGTIDSWSITVTYSGSCDLDSDAVEDHSDQCLGLAGATTSGCPLASRSVSAKYRHGKFKGALASSVPACRAAQSVTIWKVRPGPDRKVGTITTASDGSYQLRRAKRPGKYYATSPRVVVSNVAECPAVSSPRFRVG